MRDEMLTGLEHRRSVQSLMDGRWCSSGNEGMSIVAAAAAAAAEFYDTSDEDEKNMAAQLVPYSDDVVSVLLSLSGEYGVRSREGSFSSFPRKGRSASLKAFASGALAAVAAAAAAAAEVSEDPEDILDTAERMERSRPCCTHDKRNCTIILPCCGLADQLEMRLYTRGKLRVKRDGGGVVVGEIVLPSTTFKVSPKLIVRRII
mmetsp:Transcript_12840/g.14697  ORF Transcript_12840/g.14697 Transcript_12840/m.14697 type:complete len:204 (+) Transcript_12840:120-731(+)